MVQANPKAVVALISSPDALLAYAKQNTGDFLQLVKVYLTDDRLKPYQAALKYYQETTDAIDDFAEIKEKTAQAIRVLLEKHPDILKKEMEAIREKYNLKLVTPKSN